VALTGKFATVGLATLGSRAAGFLRDALIAALIGAGPVADAVFAAFLLPNLARRVLSEGAFNAAFIPVFARREATGGPGSAAAFLGGVLKAMLLAAVPATLAGLAFMPELVGLLVGGFRAAPEKFAASVHYARIAFPYVAVILLAALFAGTLNALRRYRAVAFAPILFNLVLVAALGALLLWPAGGARQVGTVIVAMVLAAGLLQLGFILAVTLRQRSALDWRAVRAGRLCDPDVRRFLLVVGPGMALAGAGHLNMLIAVQLASSMPASVSWLYYADRLFQLPLGLAATAIGIVMLPEIARHLYQGDRQAVRASFGAALEFGLAVAVPAGVALALLAQPIVTVLYRHGSFTTADGLATAAMLRPLALALPAFVLVKIALPQFLVHERFRWPLAAAGLGLVGNVVVSRLLNEAGILAAPAWGVAAAAWLNAAILWVLLWRIDGAALAEGAAARLARVGLACLATATVTWGASLALAAGFAATESFAARAGLLALACLAGLAVQGGALARLGVLDMRALRAGLARPRIADIPSEVKPR
jgi:putative peptidoglycan lipid II flippase